MPKWTFERILRDCPHNEQAIKVGNTRGQLHDFKAVNPEGVHIAWWMQYSPNGGTDTKGFRYWLKDKSGVPISNGMRYPYDHPVAAKNREEFEVVLVANIHRIPSDDDLAQQKKAKETEEVKRNAEQEERRKQRQLEAAAPELLSALKAMLKWADIGQDWTQEEKLGLIHASSEAEKAIAKAEGKEISHVEG